MRTQELHPSQEIDVFLFKSSSYNGAYAKFNLLDSSIPRILARNWPCSKSADWCSLTIHFRKLRKFSVISPHLVQSRSSLSVFFLQAASHVNFGYDPKLVGLPTPPPPPRTRHQFWRSFSHLVNSLWLPCGMSALRDPLVRFLFNRIGYLLEATSHLLPHP